MKRAKRMVAGSIPVAFLAKIYFMVTPKMTPIFWADIGYFSKNFGHILGDF